jgi:hypothetical protein
MNHMPGRLLQGSRGCPGHVARGLPRGLAGARGRRARPALHQGGRRTRRAARIGPVHGLRWPEPGR